MSVVMLCVGLGLFLLVVDLLTAPSYGNSAEPRAAGRRGLGTK